MMKIAALVVAAGQGLRAGGGLPKQFRLLAGRPVLAHAIARLAQGCAPAEIVVVLAPGCARTYARDVAPHLEGLAAPVRLVEGGDSRAASVRAGLDACGTDITHVLIHDGARPLVSPGLVARVHAALTGHDAAAPALPLTDALWRAADGRVAEIVPRTNLWRAQTPQGFALAAIRAAHARPGAEAAADDVEVARAAGLDVVLVEGEEENIKITRAQDFARAARILESTMDIRTGTGFDVHRFGPGDHVMLCGVAVPHGQGLLGHSDADVGLHALADALYGALAEGDIGRHFPPSDPQWKGAASEVFLAHAAGLARKRGFVITNLDLTLICENPRIGPHAGAMRARVAAIAGIAVDRVSVKATTTEGLGFAGRGEGIAAQAAATLLSSGAPAP